jgi:hypothetical protein
VLLARSPPWAGNGKGWPVTASFPSCPWTTTPRKGRCAGRWWTQRLLRVRLGGLRAAGPAGSSPSPPPPPAPGSTCWPTCTPTSTNAHELAAPPPRRGTDPVPALGGEPRRPHRLVQPLPTRARYHRKRPSTSPITNARVAYLPIATDGLPVLPNPSPRTTGETNPTDGNSEHLCVTSGRQPAVERATTLPVDASEFVSPRNQVNAAPRRGTRQRRGGARHGSRRCL